MDIGALLFLLVLLACPLMMVWMMRGHGHGHGHGHGSHGMPHDRPDTRSLDELRRTRDELDAEIAKIEQTEGEPTTPAAA
jgi:hypothetical protein